MKPLVSIGIPTYNRPEGLHKLLNGLLAQTYKNLEIIVSDNHSSNTKVQEVLQQAVEKDNRIIPIFQKENIGMENNFNEVFNNARGDYFMWMSDDDWFDNNYISECLNFLLSNSDYTLCSGTANYYANEKFIFREKMFSVADCKPGQRVLNYFNKVDKNGVFYGLFKYDKLPQFPVKDYLGFDWNLIATLCLKGKLKSLNNVFYHRSADGASGGRKSLRKKYGITGFKRPFFELILISNLLENLFKQQPTKPNFFYASVLKFQVAGIVAKKLLLKFIRK